MRQDQQRNIDSVRVANKTTLRFGATTVDFGIFGHHRHVDHPIFRYLDYTVSDYGGFARATDDRIIGGFRNRLIAGVNVLRRHDRLSGVRQSDRRREGCAGDVRVVEIAELFGLFGEQLLRPAERRSRLAADSSCTRSATGRIASCADGDQSGRRTWDIFSPKVGVLWDVDPKWQVFGNISRSAEVPTFDANTFTFTPASTNVNAQTATTYEIGTRGRRPDITWDVSLYRAEIRNELQCLRTSPFSLCTVVNADRTVHQGVEAGLGVAFLKSIFAQEDRFWFNVAYTYNDFFFDGDARWGNNRLPGVPPHYRPRRSALQASERLLRRSERRVDAAGVLRRQRQQPHGRPVRALELQDRLRPGHRLVRLPRRAQPARHPLHLDHDHRRTSPPPHRRSSTRARPLDLRRLALPDVRKMM